jgi:hypothetical protein
VMKQRIIESDANPVLGNHLKIFTLLMRGMKIKSLLLTTERSLRSLILEKGVMLGVLP